MRKLYFSISTLLIIFFSDISANEIDLNKSTLTSKIIAYNSPNKTQNKYIILFKDSAIISNSNVEKQIHGILKEILPSDPGLQLLNTLKSSPYGAIISTNNVFNLSSAIDDNRVKSIVSDFRIYNSSNTTQFAPPIHLDRVDQWNLPVDYRYEYQYDGTGVNVYILDSGLNHNHVDFNNVNITRREFLDDPSATPDDNTGHGTHVAGLIAGNLSGVAKNANIHSLKFRDLNTYYLLSSTLSALDYLSNHYQLPAVLNISQDLDIDEIPNVNPGDIEDLNNSIFYKIHNLIQSGVTVVASAGNYSQNSCLFPASMPSVISVGAIDDSDFKASFSNYGYCVDLFAPGNMIMSASHTNNTDYIESSGTSMSAPIVAGAAALYLDRHPAATPMQVKTAIIESTSTGQIIGLDSYSPNRILNVTGLVDPSAYSPDSYENDDHKSQLLYPLHELPPPSSNPTSFSQYRNFGDDSTDRIRFSSLAIGCGEPINGNPPSIDACEFSFHYSNPINTRIRIEDDFGNIHVNYAVEGQTYRVLREHKGRVINFKNLNGGSQANSNYRADILCGCFNQ